MSAAFTAMTLDILGNILARADNPSDLAGFVTEEIRELTGARIAILTGEFDGGSTGPRILALNPVRRQAWLETAAGRRVIELARGVGRAQAFRAGDGSALGRLTKEEGLDLSLVFPLDVGDHRVGTLIVLGGPDPEHGQAVVELLDMLTTVVALVMRNSYLFERQEQIIAERTRELREANDALRASRDRIRLALAGTHFVWDWDLERGELVIEQEWASWYGGPSNVVRGDVRSILSRLVYADDFEIVLARNLAAQRGEAPLYESEHRAVRKDGSVRWVHVRGRVQDRAPDGRPLRMMGVVSDVTDKRLMQAHLEAAERLASLGTLAAGVAHEINNPLTFIGSSIAFVRERLRDGGFSDAAVEAALSDALDGSERVREVVRGLKAFSRPDAVTVEPVDLETELRAALRITEHQLRHRARVDVRIGALPRIRAGAHQLAQVFVNLLVNAAQAIPPGGEGKAVIALAAGTDAKGWARVEVTDNGVGIPEALQAHLFEPFFTTKPQGVGTGLGLSISHGIVRAAGGRIEVESAVGKGTTVRVSLPPAEPAAVEPPSPAAEPVAPPAPAAAQPGAQKGRVLVIDDEPALARAAKRLLDQAFEVTVVNSAAEAQQVLEGGGPLDAILCDLMMPGMTGMELYRRVTERRPELAARFLFITGGAFTAEAQRFLSEAGRRWVEKPFDAASLRQMVREVAAGRPG